MEYATQIDVPSPDYGKLVSRPPIEASGELRREGNAPPPADARAMGQAWIERLEAKQALTGYGLGGKDGDRLTLDDIHTSALAARFMVSSSS